MNLFKEDTRHQDGNTVPLKSIEAVQELTDLIRTNLGPNGLSKLVITHLDKVLVTRRTETVLFNLTVEHPMAKLVVMAAKNLAAEVGDGTTQIVAWIGELLGKLKPLILMKLPIKDIVTGLDLSLEYSLSLLDKLVVDQVKDIRNYEEVEKAIKPVIGAKMAGYEDFLSHLVAQACISILPPPSSTSSSLSSISFSVDNVRFAKVMGGSIYDSTVIDGFCLPHSVEGTIKHSRNCKIAVFGCAIDRNEGETKGTIVLSKAEDLENYTQREEERMKFIIEDIASSGANVVVTGSTVSEIALHYLEKKEIMVIKLLSKFDLRRFCLATHSTALVRLGKPLPEELGFCQSIDVKEVGGMNVLVISQADPSTPTSSSSSSSSSISSTSSPSRISTILLRSATQAQLDDIERVLIDAINTYRTISRDNRLVAGGGGFEMELQKRVREYGKKNESLAQYSIEAFADSLSAVPRLLASTSGLDPNEIISQLLYNHAKGNEKDGFCCNTLSICDVTSPSISPSTSSTSTPPHPPYPLLDSIHLKEWVLRFGIDCVKSVLSVDTIIMAKPAGLKPQGDRTIGAADQD